MITKEQLISTIKELPDDFSVDDVLERIMLLEKIEIGLQQSAAGQIKSTEDAKQSLQKWLS